MNYVAKNPELQNIEITNSNQAINIEKQYINSMKQYVFRFLEDKQPLNILPKKSTLDLKRAVEKRVDRLNKRTEIAIVELLSIQY